MEPDEGVEQEQSRSVAFDGSSEPDDVRGRDET
jgi:hypothetical protein